MDYRYSKLAKTPTSHQRLWDERNNNTNISNPEQPNTPTMTMYRNHLLSCSRWWWSTTSLHASFEGPVRTILTVGARIYSNIPREFRTHTLGLRANTCACYYARKFSTLSVLAIDCHSRSPHTIVPLVERFHCVCPHPTKWQESLALRECIRVDIFCM